MSQVIFQQNEIAYLKFLDEFNTAYQQYALTSQKIGTLEKLKTKLQQAEQKLKFMQIEFGSCSPQLKAELTPKLKQHKLTYADSANKLKALEQQKQNDESQQTQASLDTRKRVEKITGSLNNQANALTHLNGKLEETAQIGDNILVELDSQKKKLLEAHEDTNFIRSDVKTTERLVKMMKNRELFNKSIKVGFVCVLTLGNLLLIYYKFVS